MEGSIVKGKQIDRTPVKPAGAPVGKRSQTSSGKSTLTAEESGKSTLVSTPPKTTGSLTSISVQNEVRKWFEDATQTRQHFLNFIQWVENDQDKLARIMTFIGLRSPSTRKLRVDRVLNQMKKDPKLKDSFDNFETQNGTQQQQWPGGGDAFADDPTEGEVEEGEGEEGEVEEGDEEKKESEGDNVPRGRQLSFDNNNEDTLSEAAMSQAAMNTQNQNTAAQPIQGIVQAALVSPPAASGTSATQSGATPASVATPAATVGPPAANVPAAGVPGVPPAPAVPPAGGGAAGGGGVTPTPSVYSYTSDQAQGEGRQQELSPSETQSLLSMPYAVTYVPPNPLVSEDSRRNLGAGTVADLPIVDMWSYLPSQPSQPDKRVQEVTFQGDPKGNMFEETGNQQEVATTNTFTYLPYAKLGGQLVWLPRNSEAAFKFFTSEDYGDLVGYIQDGPQLALLYIEQADEKEMLAMIARIHAQLAKFLGFEPIITSKASKEQIYAEWIEMRQFTKAVGVYEQNTSGMYQSSATSMSGGIRAAVAAALQKYKIPGYQTPGGKADPTPTPMVEAPPGALNKFGNKRPLPDFGIRSVSEFNIQLSNDGPDLKRTKFSYPRI